jgi:hypothetical protein
MIFLYLLISLENTLGFLFWMKRKIMKNSLKILLGITLKNGGKVYPFIVKYSPLLAELYAFWSEKIGNSLSGQKVHLRNNNIQSVTLDLNSVSLTDRHPQIELVPGKRKVYHKMCRENARNSDFPSHIYDLFVSICH